MRREVRRDPGVTKLLEQMLIDKLKEIGIGPFSPLDVRFHNFFFLLNQYKMYFFSFF